MLSNICILIGPQLRDKKKMSPSTFIIEVQLLPICVKPIALRKWQMRICETEITYLRFRIQEDVMDNLSILKITNQ